MAESTVLIKIVTRGERKAEKLRETLDRTKTVTRQLDGQLKRTFGGTATKQLDRATRGLDKFEKEAKTANRTLKSLAATAAGLGALNIGISGTGFAGFGQALNLGVVSSKRLVAEQKKLEPIQDKLAGQQQRYQANLERIAELEKRRPNLVGRTSKNIKQSAESLTKAKIAVGDIDRELKKLRASNRGLEPWIKKNTASYKQQEGVVKRIGKRLRAQKLLLKGLQGTLNRLSRVGPGGVLAGLGVGAGGAAAFGAASELEAAQTRVENLTKRYAKFTGIQELAAKSSEKFRVSQAESLTDLVNLASRLGGTNTNLDDLLNIYEGFNTLLATNKVGAQEAAGAQLQLFQALGEGKLFTQEFNSLIAATPQLLDEVAKVIEVPRGQLKKLAGEGKITSRDLITALTNIRTKGAPELENAFKGAFGAQKEFNKALKEFSAAVGKELLPVLTPLLRDLAGLLDKFGKLPDSAKTTAVAVAGIGAAALIAAPALISVAKGLSAVAVALGTAKLGAAAAGMSKFALAGVGAKAAFAALLNPVTLAAAGVVALTGAIVNYNLKQSAFNNLVENGSNDVDKLKDAIAAKKAEVEKAEGKIERLNGQLGGNARALNAAKQEAQRLKRELEQLKGVYNIKVVYGVEYEAKTPTSRLTPINPRETVSEMRERLGTAEWLKPDLPDTFNPSGSSSAAQNDTQQAKDLLRTLEQQIALTKTKEGLESELLQIEQQRRDALLEINRLQGVSPEIVAQLQGATNVLAQAESEKAIREQIKGFIADGLQKEKERKEVEKDVLDTLTGERDLLEAKLNGTEKEFRLQQQINEIRKAAPDLDRAYVESLVRGNAALEERLTKQAKMEELFDSIGATIEGGILDSINAGIDSLVDGTKELDKALQEIAAGVLKDIGQMLIKFGLNTLLSSIGGGGGIPGAIGKVFGGFKANGGPVSGGQSYIVGERGPELFTPGQSGFITPNNALGGGGNTVVNITVNTTGGSTTSSQGERAKEAAALGRLVESSVVSIINREKRPGGSLSR